MSFFGGGGGFNDPFFGNMHQQMFRQMQEMDNLMSSMMAGSMAADPFMMMQRQHMGMNPRDRMIQDARNPHASSSTNPPHQQQVMERRRGGGLLGGLMGEEDMMMGFGNRGLVGGGLLGGMMGQMEHMRERAMNDPNSHVYTHSTVVSYDGTTGGEPHYYETTNTVRKAGDVKEERKTVRDTAKGVDKMKISHRMGDKEHAIEKKRGRDGKIQENQQFKNLTQDEAREFDRQFSERVRAGTSRGGTREPLRLEKGPGPIIEEADDHHPPPHYSTTAGHRRRTNDRRQEGPIIEEIDEDDVQARNESQDTAHGSDRKRRRGLFGKKIYDG